MGKDTFSAFPSLRSLHCYPSEPSRAARILDCGGSLPRRSAAKTGAQRRHRFSTADRASKAAWLAEVHATVERCFPKRGGFTLYLVPLWPDRINAELQTRAVPSCDRHSDFDLRISFGSRSSEFGFLPRFAVGSPVAFRLNSAPHEHGLSNCRLRQRCPGPAPDLGAGHRPGWPRVEK